jgi:hypothetical protein
MSIESAIVANHLNKIQANRAVCIVLVTQCDRASAQNVVKLIALNLTCVAFGLRKVLEIAENS